eukprot:TRINITY_DN19198_c0_g1_i1.p3 TRINITY_DN19198_c0_g1~~TRINITY_DN19198_c0_g1_i1.p3  ORF type:complete len:120 (+),score=1.91 TRINITY_DN19198_c0_g1_i1:398-757(+)
MWQHKTLVFVFRHICGMRNSVSQKEVVKFIFLIVAHFFVKAQNVAIVEVLVSSTKVVKLFKTMIIQTALNNHCFKQLLYCKMEILQLLPYLLKLLLFFGSGFRSLYLVIVQQNQYVCVV